MTDSRQYPTLNDASVQLVLVDEAELDLLPEYDLYEMLVREPSFVKKDSVKYDYLPKFPGLPTCENEDPNSLSLASQPHFAKKEAGQ